jgi:hypothetical protein
MQYFCWQPLKTFLPHRSWRSEEKKNRSGRLLISRKVKSSLTCEAKDSLFSTIGYILPVFHGIMFGSVSTAVATNALELNLLPGPKTFSMRELPAAPNRGNLPTSIGDGHPLSSSAAGPAAAAAAAAAAPAATAAAAFRARRGLPMPMVNFLLASWPQCKYRLEHAFPCRPDAVHPIQTRMRHCEVYKFM